MKEKLVNGRWNLVVPDSIAEWDAPTGSAALGTGWEAQRLQSMQENLRWGDVVFDVGTEHAWLAAIIAREFVGPQSMVLMEPSPEFWPNIRKTWEYNGLARPLACWPGFVGAETTPGSHPADAGWPTCSDGHETGAMAYRSLTNNSAGIPTITVDDMVTACGVSPRALNIDVEGAELLVLQGAVEWMRRPYTPEGQHIWVSIHPDLMENFGHTPEMITGDARNLWAWEHINTDHEEHWHGWRCPF